MNDKYQNATSLFRERQEIKGIDKFKHSESRWSTVAHMALLWLSKGNGNKLNVYHSIYNSDKRQWLKKIYELNINNWTLSNSIVEGKIQDLFPEHKNSIADMEPDITLLNKKENHTEVILIEVKTVGASVKSNLENYKKLQNYINSEIDGYSCTLYYLLSFGHEDPDWGVLDKSNENILLWEDLLLAIEKSELIEYIAEIGDISHWKDLYSKPYKVGKQYQDI